MASHDSVLSKEHLDHPGVVSSPVPSAFTGGGCNIHKVENASSASSGL